MAWHHYYINCDTLYDPKENTIETCVFYEHRIPPHGSIREEWITIGMKNGSARISFVEYIKEDDDIDGVRAAYGILAESVYTFTVHAYEADPEKLFVYTLYPDGHLSTDFEIDTHKAVAILVFPARQNITAQGLLSVWEKVKEAPRYQGVKEEIVIRDLLGGKDHVMGLAFFKE